MALTSQVGAFNTTTAAATNTVAVTGVGFVPKVLLFWWAGSVSTSADTFAGGNISRGFGVATSTTSRWALGNQSQDATATGTSDRGHREDACIVTLTTAGAVDGLMDLQSFDADGFTLVIDDAFSISQRIHYLALGGADLTDAITGRFDVPGATGTQDITSAGFQPEFVMFGSIGITTDPPALLVSSHLMIGAAASSTQEAVLHNAAVDAADPMNTSSYSRAGECIASGTPSGMTQRAEFDSFLSNGFRLNWLERTAAVKIFYLALKGGSYRVDDFLTSTSGGATIVETGFGFAPKGTMLFSNGRVANTQDVIADHDQWNVGAFTSTTERGSQGTLDEDNVGTSETEVYLEHDHALAQITITPTLVGAVDVQSIEGDGFTLVMDSAANPAAFVWYVSFGDAGGAALVTPATIAVTAALPTPTILAAAQVAPAVIPVTVSLPTPTILIAPTVTPAVIPVIVTLPTPTVQAASTVTPAVIAVTVSLPTPITVVSATVNPAVIAVIVSLPTPAVLAASKVLPAVIPVTLTLPTPTIEVEEAGTVSPATIAVLASLPTPTITAMVVVTPAGITVVTTLPIPDVSTPGVATPAGISLVVTLPNPLATVGAITFWEPDPVAFVRIGPGDQPPWN